MFDIRYTLINSVPVDLLFPFFRIMFVTSMQRQDKYAGYSGILETVEPSSERVHESVCGVELVLSSIVLDPSQACNSDEFEHHLMWH